MPEKTNEPSKALPAGLLVFYDEGKGVRQPNVKVFNPSPGIEEEVNQWIRSEPGIIVHRVDWIPSGGLMGASVIYSKGHRATEALRVPLPTGGRGGGAAGQGDVAMQRLGVMLLLAGAGLALVSLAFFGMFYPDVWYGDPGAAIPLQSDLAVKSTVLVGGFAGLVATLGLGLVFWGRIRD